ncbi:hypothetical protein [Streptomyces boninensis]|uniref:hypothetical protein n=1 Tax=Streptomyces boninensis TaxID=2039455 RepID=UPI003B218043
MSMAKADRTGSWKSPELAKYATGEALSVISRGLYANRKNGLVSKGEPKLYPKVASVKPARDPATVIVKDCGDSTNWRQYRKKDGKLADDKPGGRRDIEAEVKKQPDGSWKVTEFALWELGSC